MALRFRPSASKDLFDVVQSKLNEQVNNYKAKWTKSEGLLIGRLFDDRGNRMSPTHARKGNAKHRDQFDLVMLKKTPKLRVWLRSTARFCLRIEVYL
jgi:site-specific DNA recombinase